MHTHRVKLCLCTLIIHVIINVVRFSSIVPNLGILCQPTYQSQSSGKVAQYCSFLLFSIRCSRFVSRGERKKIFFVLSLQSSLSHTNLGLQQPQLFFSAARRRKETFLLHSLGWHFPLSICYASQIKENSFTPFPWLFTAMAGRKTCGGLKRCMFSLQRK